jgi:hypothetical protein
MGGRGISRGATWGLMIVGALMAFELFNFGTTEFALRDVLGDLVFAGLRWSMILAIAFCAMDFAGIARIFTPQQGSEEPAEVWYLFGAWLLAAAFNAVLTWWGVSVAIANRVGVGSSAVGNETLTTVVPVFVAVMVWLIRVLIIGTFSIAGDRLFSTAASHSVSQRSSSSGSARSPVGQAVPMRAASSRSMPSYRKAPKPSTASIYDGVEPTYHSVTLEATAPDSGRERRLQ